MRAPIASWKGQFGCILILLALLGACAYGWRQWRLAHPDRSHVMTALTQNMRTHCVGRLLIDLPEGSTWKPDASGATIGGIHLAVETDISHERFKDYVEQRWQEIEAKKSSSKRYVQRTAERSSPLSNSTVFTYGFRRVEGPDVDGVYRKNIFHDAEGYYWIDGALFKLGPTLNGEEKIAELLPRLRARKADEVPSSPGLCLNGAFVMGYYDLAESEQITGNFNLPYDLGLRIEHTLVHEPAGSLFQRDKESLGEAAAYMAATMSTDDFYDDHKFRWAKLRAGELDGEEGVVGAIQGTKSTGYETSIGGVWEYPGLGKPSPRPMVNIKLNVPDIRTTYIPSPAGGFPKPQDVSQGPTEAEFFEVWDAVVASVRFRPGALTPPPLKPDPAPPISREQAEADQRFLDDFIASRPGGAGKPPE